jgi:hypothetical protein
LAAVSGLRDTLVFLEDKLSASSPHRYPGLEASFPWLMASLMVGGLVQALRLLGQPQAIAQYLLHGGHNPFVTDGFLYFRGWLLLGVMGALWYGYTRSRYPALAFFLIACVGLSNLVFDVFTIYHNHWQWPLDGWFAGMLGFRVVGLATLCLCTWYVGRMPPEGRWDWGRLWR